MSSVSFGEDGKREWWGDVSDHTTSNLPCIKHCHTELGQLCDHVPPTSSVSLGEDGRGGGRGEEGGGTNQTRSGSVLTGPIPPAGTIYQ